MFAQHKVVVAHPARRVAAIMAAPDHPWTVGLDGDGRQLLATVGVRIGRLPIYKHVQLSLSTLPSAVPTDRLMLPVSWAGGWRTSSLSDLSEDGGDNPC